MLSDLVAKYGLISKIRDNLLDQNKPTKIDHGDVNQVFIKTGLDPHPDIAFEIYWQTHLFRERWENHRA